MFRKVGKSILNTLKNYNTYTYNLKNQMAAMCKFKFGSHIVSPFASPAFQSF